MLQGIFTDHRCLLASMLALAFAFSNGFRDSSTIVATVVSTRILSPIAAFAFCALFEFVGALTLGSAIAVTVGRGILGQAAREPGSAMLVVVPGLAAAAAWGVISWWRAWPTSNSHALLAGLSGSAWALWGVSREQNNVIQRILLVLILSPLVGCGVSMMLTALLRFLGGWATTRVRPAMDGLHVLACLAVSLAHGSNDGQMAMGVLMVVLGLAQLWKPGHPALIPFGVRVAVAGALATGVLFGGRNILKKLGMKFYRIRPPQGLGAQLTSAATILSCGLSGFPASTTQVITGSILGAGVAKNPKAVRWQIAQDVMLSWVLTLPSVAAMAYILCRLTLFVQGRLR